MSTPATTEEITKGVENVTVNETTTTTTAPVAAAPTTSGLTVQERADLIRLVGEEIVSEESMIALLTAKQKMRCYDGFEPSGRMHIAQGILKSINVNRMTKAGCTFVFWVADWFAMLNNKMNGDLNKIRKVGLYMIEIWKATGMDLENVEFVWSSDEINKNANDYWMRVMDIARKFNVPRIKRCSQIMGRGEEDDLSVAQILYPCMQCSDIFFLKADICQLGMDQRKVNMLALEYCEKLKIKHKPVIVSHHMLMGLKEGQEKMSKSDPESAIFMEDTEAEVNLKIKKGYCPPGVIEKNPILDYLKHIIMQKFDSFSIVRSDDKGGNKTYTSYAEIEADYLSTALHPSDLKPAVALAINKILQPVRDHFTNNKEAAALLKTVKSYAVTLRPKIVLLNKNGQNWIGSGKIPYPTPNYLGHYIENEKNCSHYCKWTFGHHEDVDAVIYEAQQVGSWDRTYLTKIPLLRHKEPGEIWMNFGFEHHLYFPLGGEKDYLRLMDIGGTYDANSDVPITFSCSWGVKGVASIEDYKGKSRPFSEKRKSSLLMASNCDRGVGKCVHNAELDYEDNLDNIWADVGLTMSIKNRAAGKHLFYLAFENNNITDYISEKVFTAFIAGTVPVYMGAPNIDLYVPENSIIKTSDFASPKHLAEYLNSLMHDEVAYNKYFEWKNKPFPAHLFGEPYHVYKETGAVMMVNDPCLLITPGSTVPIVDGGFTFEAWVGDEDDIIAYMTFNDLTTFADYSVHNSILFPKNIYMTSVENKPLDLSCCTKP
eukprot:gene17526-20915_t